MFSYKSSPSNSLLRDWKYYEFEKTRQLINELKNKKHPRKVSPLGK